MILKSYEIQNIEILNHKYYLLYGENEGYKKDILNKIKLKFQGDTFSYEESEILKEKDKFLEECLNNSLFQNNKLIIISKSSDKIQNVAEEIIKKEIKDIKLILIAEKLEKKSKLRVFFEKNLNTFSVPLYEDNFQTLNTIAKKFIREKNINLSQQNINFLIERARGDRLNLKNELEKIEFLSQTKKKIDFEEILKLSNLAENYSFSDLVDSFLCKNRKNIIKILNENNFNNEDCILILKIFLFKIKRLINIKEQNIKNKNIENIINHYKPPIFWKEKELIRLQIKGWTAIQTQSLLIKVNNLELQIKKLPHLGIIAMKNFLLNYLEQANN